MIDIARSQADTVSGHQGYYSELIDAVWMDTSSTGVGGLPPEEGSGWHAALASPGQQAFFPEEAEDRR